MACKSAAHMKTASHKKTDEKDTAETGVTALRHSMKTDLTPLLMAGGFGFDRIPVFYLYEGKA